MAKEISFEFEGTRYTLAFTKMSVRAMTSNGFAPSMVTEKPAIGVPALFRGAFLANHKWIKDDLKDKIYEHMPMKQDLIAKLLEMYAEVINEMFDEPEDDEKKVTWDSNF